MNTYDRHFTDPTEFGARLLALVKTQFGYDENDNADVARVEATSGPYKYTYIVTKTDPTPSALRQVWFDPTQGAFVFRVSRWTEDDGYTWFQMENLAELNQRPAPSEVLLGQPL